MTRNAGKTRVFEEVHVVDDDGAEVCTFTREMDPRAYVLINIPEDADYVTRVMRVSSTDIPEPLRAMIDNAAMASYRP
jgi:hypothetical protein